MKRKLLFFLLILAAGGVFTVSKNNDYAATIASLTKKGIPDEFRQLKYRVYLFGLIPAGDAFIYQPEVVEFEGRKVYHMSALAKNLDYFSRIFKATARLDSFIDMRDLSPLEFRESVKLSGQPDAEKVVVYDHKRMVMTREGVERQILGQTKDSLSALLVLERMTIDSRKDLAININTNQKNYILKGVVQPQKITRGTETYSIAIAKAKMKRSDKNNPYHQSDITMVLLAKNQNIPVLIKVFASGFLVYAKLIKIE